MEQCISIPVSFVNCKTKPKSFAFKLGYFLLLLLCTEKKMRIVPVSGCFNVFKVDWSCVCLCEYGPPPWNQPLQRAWCCVHRATAGSLSPCIVTCICCDVVKNVHSATVTSLFCAGCVSFSRDDSRPLLQLVASTIQGVNAAEAQPQVRWDSVTVSSLAPTSYEYGWMVLNETRHRLFSLSKFYWQYNRSWRIKHFSPWHFFPPSLK